MSEQQYNSSPGHSPQPQAQAKTTTASAPPIFQRHRLIPKQSEDVLRERNINKVYIFPSSITINPVLGVELTVHGNGFTVELDYIITDSEGDTIQNDIIDLRYVHVY